MARQRSGERKGLSAKRRSLRHPRRSRSPPLCGGVAIAGTDASDVGFACCIIGASIFITSGSFAIISGLESTREMPSAAASVPPKGEAFVGDGDCVVCSAVPVLAPPSMDEILRMRSGLESNEPRSAPESAGFRPCKGTQEDRRDRLRGRRVRGLLRRDPGRAQGDARRRRARCGRHSRRQ